MQRLKHRSGDASSLHILDIFAYYKYDIAIIQHFEIDAKTLESWHRLGLPSYGIGRRRKLYKESEVIAFLESHKIVYQEYLDRHYKKQKIA
jgi:hypothetical protein